MQHEKEILEWLDRELSETEFKKFQKTEGYIDLFPIIEKVARLKKPEFNAKEALIQFHELKHKNNKKVISFTSWKHALAIAASIAFIITSYLIIFNNTNTVKTQFTETTKLNLPDNSEVVLNSGSSINYNKNWNDERSLKLKGEAFFKVTKGNTFDVITEQGVVTVVGTQFNVHERNNFFEVSCFEGIVRITFDNKTIMLNAGSTVNAVDGILRMVSKTSKTLPDWLQNESSFTKIPFYQVAEELERQYNVQIKFNEDLAKKNFTGNFGHSDLKTALESITFPMNLRFKISGKKVELYANE